jgi:peptidoglycan/LPS O-acetylase OafA/YrhL
LATLAAVFLTPWPFYLIGAPVELAAAAVIVSPPAVLSLKPLAFLGRISYGIYLWHLPIGLALGWPSGASGVLAVAVPSVAMATLSYFAVERWFLKPRAPGRQPLVAT